MNAPSNPVVFIGVIFVNDVDVSTAQSEQFQIAGTALIISWKQYFKKSTALVLVVIG